MKKDTLAQRLGCLVVVFIGSMICGLGVHLTLAAGLGVDPITLFSEGFAKAVSMPIGTITVLFNLLNLGAAFFLYRRSVNWGSLLATLTVGSSISFWSGIVPLAPQGFAVQLLLDVVGVLVIGFGIAIYMLPEYGIGGLEALMLYFGEKLHTPIGPTRVVMDCTWGLIGVLLGGTLGIGTVIGGVGIGMSIQLFYKPMRRLLDSRSSR